jgi:hypothetical protein
MAILEYRSDTQKVTGGTGTVEVISLGTPVPNFRVVDKVIDETAKVADILKGALEVPDITYLDMVAAIEDFGGQWPHVTQEQRQMFAALQYINQHQELLVPFTKSITAPDGTYRVVGASITLDGVPAVRYGYVPCAEPFTYAQWDRPDLPGGEEHGPHGKKRIND